MNITQSIARDITGTELSEGMIIQKYHLPEDTNITEELAQHNVETCEGCYQWCASSELIAVGDIRLCRECREDVYDR